MFTGKIEQIPEDPARPDWLVGQWQLTVLASKMSGKHLNPKAFACVTLSADGKAELRGDPARFAMNPKLLENDQWQGRKRWYWNDADRSLYFYSVDEQGIASLKYGGHRPNEAQQIFEFRTVQPGQCAVY